MSVKRVSPEKLRAFCVHALQSPGLDKRDAETAAKMLVTTDICETFSHGSYLSPRNYFNKIRAGGVDHKAKQ